MKNKIKISIVITLLIITSLFYPVNAFEIYNNTKTIDPTEEIEVIKTVWNPDLEEWVDYYEAEIDEIVTFKITITYRKTCQNGKNATDIIVIDTLPADLDYDDSSQYDESWIDGNQIYWNLTADYGIILEDNESVSFEFTASVDDYGEHENFVEVFAFENSCPNDLYGIDDATVNAEAPPYLEFDKYVYDSEQEDWVELLDTVIIDQVVKFKIVIKFVWHEEVDLMKFMIIEDYLPHCCLQYIEGSEQFDYPSEDFEDPAINVTNNNVTYDWTEKQFNLFANQTISITFESTVVKYCNEIVENWAYVDLWNCSIPQDSIHLLDSDYASVNCTAPPSTFDKWV